MNEAHIKEEIVCIRAHRERIFQVGIQRDKEKLLCHNYGHGGAGWTFLFGCVNESLRQFECALKKEPQFKNKPITVVGAGCYGLLTAILLARKGYAVRIVAKEQENIPSYKAAGFFFPRARKCSTQQERAVFEKRGMESYETYQNIIAGTHPFIKKGATLLPAYFDPDIDPGFASYIQQGLIAPSRSVIINFGHGKEYHAQEYMLIFINAGQLMQELKNAIKELNIPLIYQEITTLDDIDHPIIFNCAGMGAQKLAQDSRIVPVQGHLITLANQPIEQMRYLINFRVKQYVKQYHKQNVIGTIRNELIYYAPKDHGILGITFIRGQGSPTANYHEFERLLERCRNFFGT